MSRCATYDDLMRMKRAGIKLICAPMYGISHDVPLRSLEEASNELYLLYRTAGATTHSRPRLATVDGAFQAGYRRAG